jgi:hypothetical protein
MTRAVYIHGVTVLSSSANRHETPEVRLDTSIEVTFIDGTVKTVP